MAFPTSPTNGDTFTIGQTTFTYNSSTNQWKGTVAVSSGGSGGSSGGGSMAAPSHFGRFTTTVSFNGTDHTGGSNYGYIGQTLQSTNILDSKIKAVNNQISLQKDPASYGTAITPGGTVQDFSNAPQFCSDAAYLASNPTYTANNPNNPSNLNSGYYYCSSGGYVRYTNDAGATFNTHIPQLMSDGTIKLANVGKYRVKVKHICQIDGIANYQQPVVHTLILIDGTVKTNYVDRGAWELNGSDSNGGAKCVLRTEFDAILDVTTPNTAFSLGMAKLGGSGNTASSSTFIVSVESLF